MSIGIVVPGISNTVILMCLGVYKTYISAIASLNISILFPIGIGLLFGSILWLKLIKFLFSKYHEETFFAIIGFTLGSLFVLYPGIEFNLNGLLSVLLCFISMRLSYSLAKKDH